MSLVDQLNQIWNSILDITSMFVIPDWSAVVGLLPLLIFVGIIGPLITFLVLGIMGYQIMKPRTRVEFVDPSPQIARTGTDGQPIFPPGQPFCRSHQLIFPTGTARCDRGGEELSVICPMCGLGRPALIDTCTNCGLVLKVDPRLVPVARASGPKSGGAAVA